MKRVFVPVIFMLIVILLGCKKEDAKKDNDKIRGCRNSFSFNYNPLATEDDESCEDMHGCLGYVTGQGNSGSAGLTLSNAYWDQKMSEEVTIQRNFFGEILAAVFILYEPSPEYKNAYATPDGKILFGYFMFYYTIQSYGELPVAGILAHEWGHRVQFTVGWNDYYKLITESWRPMRFLVFTWLLQNNMHGAAFEAIMKTYMHQATIISTARCTTARLIKE